MTGESAPAPEPESQGQQTPEQQSAATPEQAGQQEPEPEQSKGDDTAALRKEAASYRRRLRDSESETERLAQRVAEMQRTAVEAQVSGPGKLADGSDIWLSGVKLEDLLDDDGAINAEKVDEALQRALADHPGWKERTPGLGGGVRGTGQPSAPSFGEALKNPSLRNRAR
jgi:hypothetical protein